MIIDFHTHIFPPDIRRNRSVYFENEPAFELLYRSPKSKLVGAKTLIQAMDDQAVDKSVVFGFPWRTKNVFKAHNDYIKASLGFRRCTGLAGIETSKSD